MDIFLQLFVGILLIGLCIGFIFLVIWLFAKTFTLAEELGQSGIIWIIIAIFIGPLFTVPVLYMIRYLKTSRDGK